MQSESDETTQHLGQVERNNNHNPRKRKTRSEEETVNNQRSDKNNTTEMNNNNNDTENVTAPPPSKRRQRRQKQENQSKDQKPYEKTPRKNKLYCKYYRDMPFMAFEEGSSPKVLTRKISLFIFILFFLLIFLANN